MLRTGGLMALDNMLQDGTVVDPQSTATNTLAIRALNDKIAADQRVTAVLLPIADGLTLAVKRWIFHTSDMSEPWSSSCRSHRTQTSRCWPKNRTCRPHECAVGRFTEVRRTRLQDGLLAQVAGEPGNAGRGWRPVLNGYEKCCGRTSRQCH